VTFSGAVKAYHKRSGEMPPNMEMPSSREGAAIPKAAVAQRLQADEGPQPERLTTENDG
jgi:hypothetical protein